MRKLFVLIIFLIFSLILAFFHEPWRDEAQAWLLVREAPDLAALIHMMGYEGTPALWHILLWPFAKIGAPFFSMAVMHALLATAAAAVFLCYAPFANWQKALVIFGYYPFYEYDVVARSYVLSMLLLFLIVAHDAKRVRAPLTHAALLALLANTNTHGFIIAGVFVVEFGWQLCSSLIRSDRGSVGRIKLLTSCSIAVIGFLLAILQLRPPPDLMPSLFLWDLSLSISHLGKIPNAIFGAFLPLPSLTPQFWNTKIFYQITPGLRVLGILIFMGALKFFRRGGRARWLYILSSAGLFALYFLKHSGQNRHHGLLYILFLSCLWIEGLPLRHPHVFTGLIQIHALAAFIAVAFEILTPFSGAVAAARTLREDFTTELAAGRVAAYPGPPALALLPHLPDGSRFFYPDKGQYGDYGTYIIWNDQHEANPQTLCDIAGKMENKSLIILNREIVAEENCAHLFTPRSNFTGSVVPDENFYFYENAGEVP